MLARRSSIAPRRGVSLELFFGSRGDENLKLRIRVPTNAFSFSHHFKFYTAEFPEYVCKEHNDFFITLLTSSFQQCPGPIPYEPCLPADKNIAFDAHQYPLSVKFAFLEVCFPPPGAPPGSCPGGTLELAGTGMGGWDGSLVDGGATVWLRNDAPVVPGPSSATRTRQSRARTRAQ